MRRRFLSLGISLIVVAWAGAVQAQDAQLVLRSTIDEVLAALGDESLSREQRLDRVQKIAEVRFDFDRMSRLVLARNWRKLSEEQRGEFLVEFKRHLSLTYGRGFEQFSDERIEIESQRTESNGDVTIKTRVVGGSADDTKIDYRMRARGGSWYVIDVIIEAVSLVSNFRSQIQEIISQKGPEHLIQTLRDKNAKEANAT